MSDDAKIEMPTSSFVAVKRCLGFLDAKERRRWALLIPLSLVTAGFEALGAALIFGLIRVIDEPSRIHTQPSLSRAYDLLGFESEGRFVIAFAGAVALFYVTKNSMLFVQVWIANKRAAISVASLSSRLLRGYLSAPYAFHFSRNSAELIRNVSTSVEAAFRSVLVAGVSMITEMMLTLAVFAVLVVAAPGVTFATGVLMGGLFWLLLKLTHRQFRSWGKQMHALSAQILSNLHQSLGGVKEVKVLGRERYFYEGFEVLRMDASRLMWRRSALEQAPRLLVETLFVLGVTGVIVSFHSAGAAQEIVPLLGLFGYAGFRIMPSLHRMVYFVNSVRYGAVSVDEIHKDWQSVLASNDELHGEDVEPLPYTDSIDIEDLTFRYPTGAREALKGVSIHIDRGEAIGIVGATGAGKSTFVDLILGLLEPTGGRISVDGVDIHDDVRRWQRRIGFVPQSIYLIDDTLRRNIALGVRDERIDEARIAESVKMAQLEPFVERLPDGLETTVGERGLRLSGGERQRVAVARALYSRPDVLVFDEATSSLDNRTEREMSRAIETLQGDKTLLIIAHRLTTVKRCDRLVFLEQGEVVAIGTYDELCRSNVKFREMAALTETEEDELEAVGL